MSGWRAWGLRPPLLTLAKIFPDPTATREMYEPVMEQYFARSARRLPSAPAPRRTHRLPGREPGARAGGGSNGAMGAWTRTMPGQVPHRRAQPAHPASSTAASPAPPGPGSWPPDRPARQHGPAVPAAGLSNGGARSAPRQPLQHRRAPSHGPRPDPRKRLFKRPPS